MKICLIAPNVFPVPAIKGGACEQIVNDIVDLNEIYNKIDLTVVSIFDEQAYEISKKYKNTEFIYIPKDEGKSIKKDLSFKETDPAFISYMDSIYEKINDIDFDFIVIEGGDMPGYNYLLKRFPKEKCIAHIHGDNIADNIYESTYQYFIGVSEYTAKFFNKDNIVSENRVFPLLNGIKIEKFDKKISEEKKIQLRKKYNISDDEVVIMFCGRTIPKKGVKELLLAVEKMKNKEKCKVLIVGNSNFGEEVKTEYDMELLEISKRIPDRVSFTGFIRNDELYKVHNISDIAVIPSMWEEPFGLVVVEAMASGLPIITTKSGGIPELVDETCAFILDRNENFIEEFSNKLEYLVEEKDIRTKMGLKAKELSSKFDMKNYYDNFIKLLKSIQ